jgi:hypothetical protein
MLKLRACHSLHEVLEETPVDLRARLKALTGQHFRRINRFIELSLLGAIGLSARCDGIAPDAAVYIACATPMLTDSIHLVRNIVHNRRPPSPFEFLNSSCNMAGFHVGQYLNLGGPQLTVQRSRIAFAATIELLTLRSPDHRRALVGYVEEGLWPLHEQRQHLPCGVNQPLAECSHWFYFDEDCEQPLALLDYQRSSDADSLLHELAVQRGDWFSVPPGQDASGSCMLAAGAGHFGDDADQSYSTGYTPRTLCEFIERRAGRRLLHLEEADDGLHAIRLQLP